MLAGLPRHKNSGSTADEERKWSSDQPTMHNWGHSRSFRKRIFKLKGQASYSSCIKKHNIPRRPYTTGHQKPVTFWSTESKSFSSVVPGHPGNSDCTAAAWEQRRIFKGEKLALWPLLPNCSHSASAWPAAAVGSEESGLCDRHGSSRSMNERS